MRDLAVAAVLAAVGAGSLVAASTLGRADDDLAVVKKAVAGPAAGPKAVRPLVVSASPAPVAAPEPTPRARTGRDPQWFKVRVVDKASGHKKVTINLPLSLVRALGDEPIDWGCREREEGEHGRCPTMRISDVLRSLEAGQELVEIDDEEATVRVWVE